MCILYYVLSRIYYVLSKIYYVLSRIYYILSSMRITLVVTTYGVTSEVICLVCRV